MYSTKKTPEHPGSANTLPNPKGATAEPAAVATAEAAARAADHSGAPRGRTSKFPPSAIMRNRANRFAALRMSPFGTNRTYRSKLAMSALRGKADNIARRQVCRCERSRGRRLADRDPIRDNSVAAIDMESDLIPT